MDLGSEIVGFAAGTLTTLCWTPQAIKIFAAATQVHFPDHADHFVLGLQSLAALWPADRLRLDHPVQCRDGRA